jgi:hypothetical protein
MRNIAPFESGGAIPERSRLIGTDPSHRGVTNSMPLSVGGSPEIILVEGLFDYAALSQAGFHNVTCSLGNHLNARQFLQLCDDSRMVYLAFDADVNGSGHLASQQIRVRQVSPSLLRSGQLG